MVVEGSNDVEFLRRISLTLHRADGNLPNLAAMEQRGEMIFIPFGGGSVRNWTERLAPLNLPEFHLYDQELPPETELRQQAADVVNQRAGCKAVLTAKRCLENYLHPEAIRLAGQIDVKFGDFDCVAELTARELAEQRLPDLVWQLQPRRSHHRMANRAKRWLNTIAADHMTADLLNERDPQGEIRSWLVSLSSLIQT